METVKIAQLIVREEEDSMFTTLGKGRIEVIITNFLKFILAAYQI